MKKRTIIIILLGIAILSIFFFYQKGSFSSFAFLNQDLESSNDRYHGMKPSQKQFEEYWQSGKKIFRGPYTSYWNAALQKEVYGIENFNVYDIIGRKVSYTSSYSNNSRKGCWATDISGPSGVYFIIS